MYQPMTLGRCVCNINFQTHIKERYIEPFLCNCPELNTPSIKYHSISSQSFKLIITLLTLGQHDGLMTIVGAYVVFHKAGVIIRSNGLLWSSVRKESCNMLLHILYGRRFNDYYAGCSSVYIVELLHQLIHISNKDNTLQHFILFSN